LGNDELDLFCRLPRIDAVDGILGYPVTSDILRISEHSVTFSVGVVRAHNSQVSFIPYGKLIYVFFSRKSFAA
jgi:hypothetical protein